MHAREMKINKNKLQVLRFIILLSCLWFHCQLLKKIIVLLSLFQKKFHLDRTHILAVCETPSSIANIRCLISVCHWINYKRTSIAGRWTNSQATKSVTRHGYSILLSIWNHDEISWARLTLYSGCTQNCWVNSSNIASYSESKNITSCLLKK